MDRASSDSWATLTPADLIRSITRRFASIFLITILVTMAVVAVLLVWPNRYASEGLMYVRLGRGAVSVDPTSQASKNVSMQETRAAEVLSVREMLASREIASRVVDRVGIEEINRPRNWIDHSVLDATDAIRQYVPQSRSEPDGMTAQEYESQIECEEAIKEVQDSITVSVAKNAYTVAVICKSDDPVLAQQIAQAVMDEYGVFHVEAHRATGSLEFFENEVLASRKLAVDSRSLLQETKSRLGWSSEKSGEAILQERITKLEIALDEAESSLAERESRVESLTDRLAKVDEWIPMQVTRGVANNASDVMRTQLYSLEMQENDALARLKPNHPRYRMLKDMVDQSKQIVDDEGDDKELSVEAINPVRQEMEKNYEFAIADTAGFKSRVESLTNSLAEANQDLCRLNTDGLELAKLTWESSLAEQNFLAHSKSLEEARMLDELDSDNLSDVSVVQDASLQLKKIGPPRALLAMLGCLLGLSLGLLQAILRDTPAAPRRKTELPQEPNAPASETRELVGSSASSRKGAHGASLGTAAAVGLPR